MKKQIIKAESLNETQKLLILKLHAEGNSDENISALIDKKLKISLTTDAIRDICLTSDNQVYIERFRDKYLANVKSVPIANKRVRLDDYQEIRNKLFEMVNTLSAKGKEGRTELITIFRTIKDILATTREEMEGTPKSLTQINITDLTGLTDEELRKRKEILIAKELGTYVERNIGIGEDSEGRSSAEDVEPVEVPLASPIKL